MPTTNDSMNNTKLETSELDHAIFPPAKGTDASITEVDSSAQLLYQNDTNSTSVFDSTRQLLTRDVEKVSDAIAADAQPEGGTQAWVTVVGA